jgi:hypothetical protein
MAYTECGNPALDKPTWMDGTSTWIILDNPITSPGVLKEFVAFITTSVAGKIKIFRDDGANYVFIGEASFSAPGVGLRTLSTLVPGAEIGDLIGFFGPNIDGEDGSGGLGMYKAGDITTTTAKATWASLGRRGLLTGRIFHRVGVM